MFEGTTVEKFPDVKNDIIPMICRSTVSPNQYKLIYRYSTVNLQYKKK